MSKLKLITTTVPTDNNLLYIKNRADESPVLAYKSGGSVIELNKGGSPRSELVKCSDLKELLGEYFIKGTKFIASTYNPTLYYLFPGSSYDSQFIPETNFIPTLKISELIRGEVDGFDPSFTVTQASLKSIKACDNWYNNTEEYQEIVNSIDERVEEIFGYYKDFNIEDVDKEVKDKTGDYSVDISKESIVVSLLSDTSYTDTINLEDWVYKSGKGTNEVSGKLDISFMYSKEGRIYGGMQTIKAFEYNTSGNVIPQDTILNLGDVQIEYLGYVLKIYPVSQDIDEVIINDCTLTIGVLS